MPAADLPTEALAFAWAVEIEAVTWGEVVAWADGWILRLDAPPVELLELSLSVRRPNKAFTLLRRLAQGGDPDAALAALARRLLDGVEESRLEATFLAGHLERLQFLSFREVPDDVRLSSLPAEFLSAAHNLWYLTEPWNPDFTPDVTAEVVETLRRFL